MKRNSNGATTKPAIEDPSCGNCAHFRAHEQFMGMGQCWLGPPQMIASMQNGVPGLVPVRPVVAQRERPCGQWKLAPSIAEAISKPAPSQAEGGGK